MAHYLILGEAPGPHGCRFSGVPFTTEAQLLVGHLKFSGQQSSNRKEPYYAPASKIFWNIMLPYALQGKPFFIWNCVPLHPHKKDEPLSVRNPTSTEIRRYSSGLSKLVEVIQPIQVIAVGRKAQEALFKINVQAIYARHPSMGGASKFKNKMKELLMI